MTQALADIADPIIFAKKRPFTCVVHPTLTVSDRRTREIMATPGGKMMNVRGLTQALDTQ